MNTHTIRTIKKSGVECHKIVTFTPKYLKMLKESHIDSQAIIINYLLTFCEKRKGKKYLVNWEQQMELEDQFKDQINKPIHRSLYKNQIRNYFINGVMGAPSLDLIDDLKMMNAFFNHLDKMEI
jgi:hypothetical protein